MRSHFAIQVVTTGVGLLALSATTLAQTQAYTTAPVDIYAGPAPDYPIVAQVAGGAPLTVMGCVEDYSWCDVAAPGLRGWAYGGYLTYPYQGEDVPVMTYGATIGLPIIVFSIDSYWGRHYRDRSWYHDEPRWTHHPPPDRGARPPERGDMGRPPGPQPGHEAPAYGGAPGAPPVHGGPQPQPQAQRGMQPGDSDAHATGGPQMRADPGATPAPRGGAEARGDQARGAGGEQKDRQSNH